MDFSDWLSQQRHTLNTLRVVPGRYWARRLRSGAYEAGTLSTSSTSLAVVEITSRVYVRARVTLASSEYDFAPVWTKGTGLDARRVSPDWCSPATAAETKAFARAALLCAAEHEYNRLCGIASDVDEDRAEEVLVALTALPTESCSLDAVLRASVVAAIAVRGDAFELAVVPHDGRCVGCDTFFQAGTKALVLVSGSTMACASCARPARAA